jgi:NitT/TauT family transport system permease protein
MIKKYFITLLPLIIFLILWEYYFSTIGKNTFLFSKPSLIFNSLYTNIQDFTLVEDFITTSTETILGFIIGSAIGIGIGFSLWYSPKLASISTPYIVALGSIPIFSLAPMTIMWFGTGLFAKVIMAALSTFTVALLQAFMGAKNVDKNQINLLKTFGASRFQIFKTVIIPSSLSWVMSSLKMNVGFALLGAFIGEFISAEKGLGFRIVKASALYNTSLVFASLFCLLLLAFILNYFVTLIENKLFFWKVKN